MHVPDFGRVVEGAGYQLVPVRVEIQAYNFRAMPSQRAKLEAAFNVPEFCRTVHRASCNNFAMRVKRQANDLRAVAPERVRQLACARIPELGSLVERSCNNLQRGRGRQTGRTGPSQAAEETLSPKGLLNAMAYTTFLWPSSVKSSSPVNVFQTLHVRS